MSAQGKSVKLGGTTERTASSYQMDRAGRFLLSVRRTRSTEVLTVTGAQALIECLKREQVEQG